LTKEQRQSDLVKKGETDSHATAVLRLKSIADGLGYRTKKDHTISEIIDEDSEFISRGIYIDDLYYRLDLVMIPKYGLVIAEVDGHRHDSKIVQAKDDTKTKEVCTILRRFDPFFIRFKIYTLIGKYAWSDGDIQKVLLQPQKYHLKTIA
jgi:hypothetical protein